MSMEHAQSSKEDRQQQQQQQQQQLEWMRQRLEALEQENARLKQNQQSAQTTTAPIVPNLGAAAPTLAGSGSKGPTTGAAAGPPATVYTDGGGGGGVRGGSINMNRSGEYKDQGYYHSLYNNQNNNSNNEDEDAGSVGGIFGDSDEEDDYSEKQRPTVHLAWMGVDSNDKTNMGISNVRRPSASLTPAALVAAEAFAAAAAAGKNPAMEMKGGNSHHYFYQSDSRRGNFNQPPSQPSSQHHQIDYRRNNIQTSHDSVRRPHADTLVKEQKKKNAHATPPFTHFSLFSISEQSLVNLLVTQQDVMVDQGPRFMDAYSFPVYRYKQQQQPLLGPPQQGQEQGEKLPIKQQRLLTPLVECLDHFKTPPSAQITSSTSGSSITEKNQNSAAAAAATTTTQQQALLSTFCFPNGIAVKFIPRAASAFKTTTTIATTSTTTRRFHSFVYVNETEISVHGVCITVREPVGLILPPPSSSCSNDSNGDTNNNNKNAAQHQGTLIKSIEKLRKRRQACCTIQRWWQKLIAVRLVLQIMRLWGIPEEEEEDEQQHQLQHQDEEEEEMNSIVGSIVGSSAVGGSINGKKTSKTSSSSSSNRRRRQRRRNRRHRRILKMTNLRINELRQMEKSLSLQQEKKKKTGTVAGSGAGAGPGAAMSQPTQNGDNSMAATATAVGEKSPPAKKPEHKQHAFKKKLLEKVLWKGERGNTYRIGASSSSTGPSSHKKKSRRASSSKASGASVSSMTVASTSKHQPQQQKPISEWAKERGAESYRAMLEADQKGLSCIVEKAYVLVGCRPEERALVFGALERMVDAEAEKKHQLGIELEPLNSHNEAQVKRQEVSFVQNRERHVILNALARKLQLSEWHASVSYPASQLELLRRRQQHHSQFYFEADIPMLAPSSSSSNSNYYYNPGGTIIRMPLPLPQIGKHWGLARLLLLFEPDSFMHVLMLLLLERSVLVVGDEVEEVTACSCALLELLKPYQWPDAFVPMLPYPMWKDFVKNNSGTPLVAGIAVSQRRAVDMDHSVVDTMAALSKPLSILNLTTRALYLTTENNVSNLLNVDPHLRETLESLRNRLLYLASHPDHDHNNATPAPAPAITCFSTFIRHGLSPKETLTLNTVCDTLECHFRDLGSTIAASSASTTITTTTSAATMKHSSQQRRPQHLHHPAVVSWEKYGSFNQENNTYNFEPDTFMAHLRHKVMFQEVMVGTRLFRAFIRKRRLEDRQRAELLQRGQVGKFIASWIYLRWMMRRDRDVQMRSSNTNNKH